VVVTGNAPTSGNVYGNGEERIRIEAQSTIKGGRRKRRRKRKVHEERVIARVEKTKELQFFILEEESNQKA